jgi:hypothetical protein
MFRLSKCILYTPPVGIGTVLAGYRSLSTSCFVRSKDVKRVPVMTYDHGLGNGIDAARRTTLAVDELKSASKPIHGRSTRRQVVAFDRSVVPILTPTLRSFTIEGKVAVITG